MFTNEHAAGAQDRRFDASSGVAPRAVSKLDYDHGGESVRPGCAATAGLLAGLEQTGQAAAILDGDGRVISMNRRAEGCVGEEIFLLDGRLAGRSRAVDARLKSLVGHVLHPTGATQHSKSKIAVVPRPDGFPLIVEGTTIDVGHPPIFRQAKALVTFTHTGIEALPTANLLRETFGLTAAEAAIALSLAGGASARATAEARGIGLETVRSHLKTVFVKTGTKRQATLVALIVRMRGLPV